jgi:tetratricopeptide (TPR) repeat protein
MFNNNDDAYNPERDQQLDALMKNGQYEQALALLQAWNEREPWNGEVLMRMAVVHWLTGEPARTLRDLDAFLTLYPDHAEALSRRAQALIMLGKRADAEQALLRAEAIDPNTPGVALNRALLLEADGKYDQAIDALTAYLQAVPSDHLALARRSHLRRQLGAYTEALEDADACVKMRPDDPETHFAKALAHVTLEQGQEALAACDQSLKLKPSFLPALRLKIDLLAPDGSVYALKASSGSDSADNVVATYTVNLSTEALNGAWKLRVQDVAAGDVGTLNSWSITF